MSKPPETKTAMAVGAHPDDVEFGMGGTLVQLVEAGWNVVVVDLTDGEPTPYGSRSLRARETAKASAILGIAKRTCLNLPNRYLKVTTRTRKAVAALIRLHRPTLIFSPHEGDPHPDHTQAYRLIEVSRFEAKLYRTSVPGEPYWARRQYSYPPIHQPTCEKPSFVVDITRVWDRKVAAIGAYESQLEKHASAPETGWLDRVEATNRYFGQWVDCKYAEAFFSTTPLSSHELALLAVLNPDH